MFKNDSEYQLYDNVSFPVIIVSDDLTVVYSNETAKKNFSSICREGSLRPFLNVDVTQVCRKLNNGKIVTLSGNLGAYVFISIVPFISNGKHMAFVSAEHSFSVYKSTDGFRNEKIIVDAFSSEYDIHSRRINGLLDYAKRVAADSSQKQILPYLNSISANIDHVDGMIENLMSILRLHSLFAENGVECIDLLRFLADLDKIHGVLELCKYPEDNVNVLYNKDELCTVCSDIIAFLLEDTDGSQSVKVDMRSTNTHILITFSVPAHKRSFTVNNAFSLQNGSRKNSLFFVRKTVERRGGNVIFRKNLNRYEVLFSVRKMLPQSYSGYLTNDSVEFDLT